MPTRPRRLLPTLLIVFLLAACGPSGVATTPRPTSNPTTAAATATPSEPAATGAAPTSPTPQDGQTDTAWGRIWDAVPAGFPTYPGSTPADDASAEPASARYVVTGGDPEAIAAWMQAAFETATFSTEALSGPFEDGSLTLESTGDGACRIQTTIAPLGAMTFVTVFYGAACPAG